MKFKHSDINELEEKVAKYLDVGMLKRVLREVVQNNGEQIYLADYSLHAKLYEYTQDGKYGMTSADVERVCLVASLPIFKKMITYQKKYTTQAEFCTFVNSAIEETGLMKYVAYGVVCAICYSLNWIEEINSLAASDIGDFHEVKKGIGIPYSVYDMRALNDAASDNASMESNREILKYYAQLGIPKAKYLLARTMDCSKEESEGFKMMLSAANDGDSEASIFLGDYYYGKFESTCDKAYKYYTGYGHAILHPRERNNVTNILNKRQYSKWMVVANWIFVVLTLILLVCIPPFSVFRGQVIFGIIALVLEIGIALVGIKWYKDSPFTDDVSFITIVNFVIWMIFIMLRIGL